MIRFLSLLSGNRVDLSGSFYARSFFVAIDGDARVQTLLYSVSETFLLRDDNEEQKRS